MNYTNIIKKNKIYIRPLLNEDITARYLSWFKNYFYNKIENKVIISDKIFVGCENNNFDMDLLKKWRPIS